MPSQFLRGKRQVALNSSFLIENYRKILCIIFTSLPTEVMSSEMNIVRTRSQRTERVPHRLSDRLPSASL